MQQQYFAGIKMPCPWKCWYNLRIYNIETGLWASRDPIDEYGGVVGDRPDVPIGGVLLFWSLSHMSAAPTGINGMMKRKRAKTVENDTLPEIDVL